MIDFIKENSSNAIKLFVNQIAMTIFGLLLSAASFQDTRIKIAAGLLSMLFYFYLLYTAAWDIGARDKVKIDGGRMRYAPQKGLYISLIANSLNIILAVFSVVFYFVGTVWANTIVAVTFPWLKLLNGMYIALISFTTGNNTLHIFLTAATVIPTVTVSALGYLAGVKNHRIFGKFTAKKYK